MIINGKSSITELIALGDETNTYDCDDNTYERVEQSYINLQRYLLSDNKKIYGIHTHYGYNVKDHVHADDWQDHQLGLLNYLKVGVGAALDKGIVRRALRLQAHKSGLGLSGIHPNTYRALISLCNNTAIPNVPRYGSLGASGDLIPMAHAVAPLFEIVKPQGPRDVIGLVNTNAMMASLAADCLQKTNEFYRQAHLIWLFSASALGWKDYGLQEKGWNARQSQRTFRSDWIHGISLLQSELNSLIPDAPISESLPVQEKYSIRCAPQLLLDLGENLNFAKSKILEEAFGLADNPIIFEDGAWHGGHFYTSGLATAADLMNDSVSRISDMIDRQMLILVTADLNHGLPSNLGIASGDHLKGLHQLTSALLQRMKSHQSSSRSLSFSSESNNQDIVPASMNALLQLSDLLELSSEIMRAATFISERAFRLANKMKLPDRLLLKSWPYHSSQMSWEANDIRLPTMV